MALKNPQKKINLKTHIHKRKEGGKQGVREGRKEEGKEGRIEEGRKEINPKTFSFASQPSTVLESEAGGEF